MAKRVGLITLLCVLLLVLVPLRPGTASSDRPDGLRAGQWRADGSDRSHEPDGQLVVADFPVNALMVDWARDGAPTEVAIQVSVSVDGRTWTPWQDAPVDEDDDGRFLNDRVSTSAILVQPSRYFRVRAVDANGDPGPRLPDLQLAYVNTLAGPGTDGAWLESEASAPFDAFAKKKKKPTPTPPPGAEPTGPAALPIISRAAWGADESLRFVKGKETWPPEYQIPEKVILHHTETPNDQDPMAAVRSVYYFHAVRKGWGDIGYNYLVDSSGRIYEGRFGGDHVIGGHALSYNSGSIGIAVLGSYQANSISPAAEDAIVNLIVSKARFIDPVGQAWFVDKTLPNIAGHRDCLPTSCPGNAFYPRLPAIRDKVLKRLGFRPTADVRITDAQISPTALKTGESIELKVTVTNVGSAVMPGDPKGLGLTYIEGQDYQARGLPKVTGKLRVGLEPADGSAPYPYRWGLGRAILPGESIVVTGRVTMANPQERTYQLALVQEFVKYWQEDIAPTHIHVEGKPVQLLPPTTPVPPSAPTTGPLPTDPVPAPTTPESHRTYFPETGHYLAYGFRAYWQKNGGLARFGLPLTDEFKELNPADGKTYMVQYFERARFEYHPENKGTRYEVLLGLLGNQVTEGRNFPKTDPAGKAPRPDGRYFPETRQWVSGPILKYWNANGGLMTYGYPISPEFDEVNPDDGRTYRVQYFERNRLEYHPEHKGTPYEVLLGLLGRQVLVGRGWLTR